MDQKRGSKKQILSPIYQYFLSARDIIGIIFLIILTLSCTKQNQEIDPDALFENLSSKTTGIDFINQLNETEDFNIIEYLYFYNGGGVAVGDINNDGLPDIYFTANQVPNKLYLNKGNFQFEDITEQAGLESPGQWKTGVTMVDINGDGFLDVYVCRLGNYKGIEGKNELYINNGDLTFTESAAIYGLDFQGFSTHAAFFDYDLDGDLDMYLLNHAVHTEKSYGTASLRYLDDGFSGDRLFRNNADKGEKKFSPVTHEAGIFSSHIGYGLGIGVSDINNDGWPDIYISNDFNENDYLYINQGDGTFKEQIHEAISYSSRFSMGNDLADFNNDGWIDMITLDMMPEDEVTQKLSAGDDPYEIYQLKLNFGYERQAARNMLHLNRGNGTFSEIGQLSGINASDWSWAALFADFDHDGYKDLFIANGILRRPNDMDYINFIMDNDPEAKKKKSAISNLELASKMPPGKTHNYFYKNNRDLTFSDVSEKWGLNELTASNGAVYVDLDNDGDLDLVVNHLNQTAGVFKNRLIEKRKGEDNAYLKIKFEGSTFNRFGIGAKVIAFVGGLKITQENYVSRGFQSSVVPEIHFGLGNNPILDSLLVIWPGGKSQTLKSVKTNQTIRMKESEANTFYNYEKTYPPTLLESVFLSEYGLDFEHAEDDYNDFNLEPLLPHKISKEGPALAIGDINGDGLDDMFLGGAKNQPATIYHQQPNGKFKKIAAPIIESDSIYEDVSAIFFDSNNNGFLDLYVVSGGNVLDSPAQDRLYINNGNGEFIKNEIHQFPVHQGSVVLAEDFDKDGWIDLFIGGRVKAGNYGEIPKSYLFKNLGDGNFEDVTDQLAPGLSNVGMVKDAVWTDIDQDGWKELVLVGEWMPITIFSNGKGKLTHQTDFSIDNSYGWWNTVYSEDLTGDGFPDLVVGNLGLNSRLKASESNPINMYVKDFDQNGSLDAIITQSIAGKKYTLATKEELVKKIPSLKKQFIKHRDFAGKTVEEIFQDYELNKAQKFEANEFRSLILINMKGKGFQKQPLPLEAQFSPIQAVWSEDINGDGCKDLLIGGNQTDVSSYFGAYQGIQGLVLLGNCQGEFEAVSALSSSLKISGDIKHIRPIKTGKEILIMFVKNDDVMEGYKIKN